MTVYEVVNSTVIRRRRSGTDVVDEEPAKGDARKLPRISDEVRRDFRSHNQLGRRSRSTR